MASEDAKLYDKKFYISQKNGSYAAAKQICPFVLSLFPQTHSVIDIGCGAGGWLAWFAAQGKTITGYDFGEGVEENLFISQEHYHTADLSLPLKLNHRFDLAISLEVGEHIEESGADIFVANLCNASDIILFSAAIPKQGGHHHVNCQWPEYWAQKFSTRGYAAFDILRPLFWQIDAIPWWYRQNMILYINKNAGIDVAHLDKYNTFNCLPIRHPNC